MCSNWFKITVSISFCFGQVEPMVTPKEKINNNGSLVNLGTNAINTSKAPNKSINVATFIIVMFQKVSRRIIIIVYKIPTIYIVNKAALGFKAKKLIFGDGYNGFARICTCMFVSFNAFTSESL